MSDKTLKLVFSKPNKTEIKDAIEIFFNQFTDEQFAQESMEFFLDHAEVHGQNIGQRHSNPELYAARWAVIQDEIPAAVMKKKNRLKQTESHTSNLGFNVGEAEFNDVKLAREYLKAWFGNFEKSGDLKDAVYLAIKEVGGLPVSKEVIASVYSNIVYNRDKETLDKLIKKISWDGKTSPEQALAVFRILLKPALLKETELELAAKCLYHFMWQVKRKMLGLKVEQHLALVFISKKKGNGKSEFVRSFCRIFKEANDSFYSERDIDDVAEESRVRNMVDNFIVNFDDMRSPKKGNFQSFRTFVTSESLKVRMLYNNMEDTLRSKFTCIASANAEKIGDIYDDMQGERRLLGISVTESGFKNIALTPETRALGHLSPAQLEKGYIYPKEGFKSEVFWKMVDENSDVQVSAAELEAHQADDVPENGIEAFAQHYGIQPGPSKYPVKRMYEIYKEHQHKMGNRYRILNSADFGHQLIDWIIAKCDQSLKPADIKKATTYGQYRDTTCYYLTLNSSLDAAYNRSIISKG